MNLSTLREIHTIADPIERARALGSLMARYQGLLEEAARMRRQAIAEARESGHRLEEIATVLGVSPGRVSQMRKAASARAPEPPAEPGPSVIVHRALPTAPGPDGIARAFITTAERQGVRPDMRFLHVGSEPSSEHVATCLRVRPGDDVIARRRLILADEVPVRLVTSYFRADLFGGTTVADPDLADPDLADPDLARPSLQSRFEALGHTFGHAEETLVARPAARYEIETLDLDPGEWVIQVLRASYSTEDTPVHILETICAASRHIFTVSQAGGLHEF